MVSGGSTALPFVRGGGWAGPGLTDAVGAGAVQAHGQERGHRLAGRAARAYGLAADGDGAEREREQAGGRGQHQQQTGGLRVGRFQRVAPEELPAREGEHQRDERRREAEELWDQQLREERADGTDEVVGGGAG